MKKRYRPYGFGFVAVMLILSFAVRPSFATITLESINLPAVKKVPWRFTRFPIIAFWGPPGDATLKDFENYRDAGFSLYMANPDTEFYSAVDKATSVGVPILAFRDKQGFNIKKAITVFPEDHPNIVGWGTRDEPGTPEAAYEAIRMGNDLMQKDPSRWAMFNALPPHVPNVAHNKIAAASVRNGLPIISYDNYVIAEDGSTNEAQHFENVEKYRKWSKKLDVPFWAFALTIKHFHYRRASESDVRWKQFTNLAYGAKGLWYFTYWGPTAWENWDNKAIVNPADGSKTELYDYVKAINENVQGMGQTLLKLTCDEVTHTTGVPEGQTTFTKGRRWISDIKADTAMVSFFTHENGDRYAMIVNKQHGKDKSAASLADTMTVTFDPAVKTVEAVAWLDGNPGPLELKDHKATMRINGGTGVLLHLKDSTKEFQPAKAGKKGKRGRAKR